MQEMIAHRFYIIFVSCMLSRFILALIFFLVKCTSRIVLHIHYLALHIFYVYLS